MSANEPAVRLWWEQTTVHWELPFFTEMGFSVLPEWHEYQAAREQLWAMRELDEEPGVEEILIKGEDHDGKNREVD